MDTKLLLLAPCVLLAGCYVDINDHRYEAGFHYSYDVAPNARVRIQNSNGSIEVSGWDQNKVEISGRRFGSTEQLGDQVKIEIDHSNDAVEVRTSHPTVSFGNTGAEFVIHVPRKALLDRISDTNGRVTVRNVEGGARIRTTNGPITAEHISGGADAHSTNGRVLVQIDDPLDQPVTVQSTNGALEVELDKAPKANVRVETTNGSVTARLPGTLAGRVTADTNTGSITSEFDIASQHEHETKRHRHIEGQVGTGGPEIDLTTHNGSIRILKSGSN